MLRAGRSDAASAGWRSFAANYDSYFCDFFFFLAFRFRKKEQKKRALKGRVASYAVAVAARLESDGPSRERGNGRKDEKNKCGSAKSPTQPRSATVFRRRRGSRSMRASGVANPSGLLKASAVPRWVKSDRTSFDAGKRSLEGECCYAVAFQ